MEIDTKTQTFYSLTRDEAALLQESVEKLVLTGEVTSELTFFFEYWCSSLNYTPEQAGILMATAFPQRALLSLLWFATTP